MSLKPKSVNFDQIWADLKIIVKDIVSLKRVQIKDWHSSFSVVYSLCTANPEPFADRLYTETELLLKNHVIDLLRTEILTEDNKLLITNESNDEFPLLAKYSKLWSNYENGIMFLDVLYLYLNTQHIKKQKQSEAEIIYGSIITTDYDKMEIKELGLDLWKWHMIMPLKDYLLSFCLQGIDRARTGSLNSEERKNLKTVINSFVEVEGYKKKGNLNLYRDVFETTFLEACAQYYKFEASKLLQHCTVSEYMEQVIQKLHEEVSCTQVYLHSSTHPKLRRKSEECMVLEHKDFLYSEVYEMVSQEKKSDLRNMYTLLQPIENGLTKLIATLNEHIKQEGMRILSGLKGENIHVQFVEQMLEIHKKYKQIISEVFSNDQLFCSAMDKACATVINARITERAPCRSPELLSKYCDSLLKKSSKGISESEIDEKLTASITIFKYIDDKDMFQKFYSRMLAKRLIHQQSHSMDSEEAMIDRLKQACGYEFTNKLHRMFTDMSISSDLNAKFQNYIKDNSFDLGINMYMLVLQTGAWPLGQTQTQCAITVPQELEKSMQIFESFYHNHFSGRKLNWLHSLCNCEIKLSYLKKTYIITMQTYQMAILFLFEHADTLLYKDIEEALQLTNETLQKHIASLVDSKLLVVATEGDLVSNSKISLNLEYSNKRTKFKITAALQRDTPQEVEHTMTAVEDDRKMFIQAAIVRIMKSRKVLKHNALIQEVLSQSKVNFNPNIAMIKKCIESLIDKQYIERKQNTSDEYSYVA